MVYNSTSIEVVIGKLLRNTKLRDSSYIQELFEWIPEAMKMMQTQVELKPYYKILQVKKHHAKLPCGIVSLDAVVYKGARLREGSTQAHVCSMPSLLSNAEATTSVWIPDTDVTVENHLETRLRGTDLIPLEFSSSDFYKLQLDYIQTSFECGEMTIYFHKMPVDCNGYPLIPDNENYREALYWFMRMKMIESGWEDPLFDWNHCWNMWEHIYAPRAINEIRYPSVDRMERLLQSTVRLIPPTHFYTDLFTGAEQYQDIRK